MLFWLAKRKDAASVSDASVRYEGAKKSNKVYSLAFEATQHDLVKDKQAFVLAVAAACKEAVKQLVLMKQVELMEGHILAPQKNLRTWLPALVRTANDRNQVVTVQSLVGEKHVAPFCSLLNAIVKQDGVYELGPGLALFGDNGTLKVTASRGFIKNLNNE